MIPLVALAVFMCLGTILLAEGSRLKPGGGDLGQRPEYPDAPEGLQ